MSRMKNCKRAFTLMETTITLVIVGFLMAMTFGVLNYSNFKNNTLVAKQARLESALRSATISIIGQGTKLKAEDACSPATMRDKYVQKLTNAKAIDDVKVNGVNKPALRIQNYGVVAFDAASDCTNKWHAGSIVNRKPASLPEEYTSSVPLSGPVVLYSSLEDTEAITVPASVSANSSTPESSSFTQNTMAFAVDESGIVTTYNTLVATEATANFQNHGINSCSLGDKYEYVSSVCKDEQGGNLRVAFYQMLNEYDCNSDSGDSKFLSYCPGNGLDNDGNLILTGQINLLCKYGDGSVLQCGCPAGKEYYASRYVTANSSVSGICLESCAELNMIEYPEGSKLCECPTGTIWNSTVRKCITPGECPESYQKWDEILNQCVCKSEAELGEDYFDVCEIYDATKINDGCKRLNDNWDKTTGTCVCPKPFTQHDKLCTCDDPRSIIEGVCQCDATKVSLDNEEIFDPSSETCIYDCAQDGLIANPARTSCVAPSCGCLKKYDFATRTCVCDPSQAGDTTCINPDEKFDASSPICKTCKSPNRTYDVNYNCICKPASQITMNEYEIYDSTELNCIYTCKDGAVANSNHTECKGGCLQQYNRQTEKLECIPNPSDAKTTECLRGSNFISDPSSAICKQECDENKMPNDVYKACQCKPASQITMGTYEIYDASSQTCKYVCKDGAVANSNHNECIGDCLQQYNRQAEKLECIPNPSDAKTIECLRNTNFISDTSSLNCKQECSENKMPNDVYKACQCKPASQITMGTYEIYDASSQTCKYVCKDGAVANSNHTECKGDCLQQYNRQEEKLECIPNPSDAKTTECLRNTNFISNTDLSNCKEECPENRTPNNVYKMCICKSASEIQMGRYEIYDPTGVGCIYTCKDGAIANSTHTECIGGCLQIYNYQTEKLECIQNPSDAKTTECLRNTNMISDPSVASCQVECSELTSPNSVHKVCACDRSKVTTALNQQGNLNKIYDLENAPTCMMACQGQTFPTQDRTSCRPVDCLYETTDNITQHCIANPSDALTQACLQDTNYISNPAAATCKVECTGLTSPNGVHKACPCDRAKVTTALNQTGNLNKIYDLNNAPTCMAACTGQTFPNTDRYSCRPVDCLYETTDNITQHCIPHPTDAQTTECLRNTNYISDPTVASCKVDCGRKHSPNNVYKLCACDIVKMENQYTSINMKFDATSATCESPCPSSFTYRNPDDASTCKCPTSKPESVTVQPGYFYTASSTVLTGNYACQLECPTTQPGINDWMYLHSQLFINDKVVYDSTKAGCLSQCTGNYVASPDKLTCICGINATNCQPGTYFDGNSCECKLCEKGHYCPGVTPENPTGGMVECPCGTYGDVKGLQTAACSGQCQAGYYCEPASQTPTQHACQAGQACTQGSCSPVACDFPSTSVSPFTSCNQCQTEQQIKNTQPNYFKDNEIWVNDLSKQCKKCKSNMVYNQKNECVCPADKPYWNGQECSPCKNWGTLFFARQSENRPNCTLYDHMMGKKGACFDLARVPSNDMKQAANALSSADKNRKFDGIYAYMVEYRDGKATVAGVFTARSWYQTFPSDYSSVNTARSQQMPGNCNTVCGGNQECIATCDYMKGKIIQNTMFSTCSYAVNNQFLGNTYNNASDELCTGGIIKVASPNECVYGVGGILRNVTSPLVLDLKGNGFKYTSVEDGVVFDLDNDGTAERTAWTTEQKEFDNAFLVLDKNKNGQVDNGGELFGDQNGSENGFLELAKYDDNGDRVISDKDKIYNDLLLWVDFNKNAKVDYDADGSTKELKTLKEAGVTEISVDYKIEHENNGNILHDIYGNITGFIGSFKMMVQNAAGKLVEVVRSMMDVFFVTD